MRRICAVAMAVGLMVIGLATIASPAAAHVNGCPAGTSDLVGLNWPAACRDFIIDPGSGSRIDRSLLLANEGLLTSRQAGFTQNFLWYSSETQITVTDPDVRWTSCRGLPGPHNSCAPDRIEANHHADFPSPSQPNSVLRAFHVNGQDGHPLGSVALSVFEFGGMWISTMCGNWHDIAARPNPVPSIGGVKFRDADRDGLQDPGEGGLAGWQIRVTRESTLLDQPTGVVVADLTTDGLGRYRFDLNGHGPGRYRVEEVVQPDWKAYSPVSQTIDVPFGARDSSYTVNFGNAETITDVRKAAFSLVSPPSRIEINQPTPLHIRSVVTNNGPAGPIAVDEVLAVVSKPEDCTITGLPVPRRVVLGVNGSQQFDDILTLTCSKRSDHPFTFGNDVTVATADVVDIDPTNNTATTEVSIPVFEQTSLALGGLSLVCDQYWAGNPFTCTAQATATNSGVAPHAHLLTTFVLGGAATCTATPDRVQPVAIIVGAGLSQLVATSWTVTCPDDRLRTFLLDVSLAVNEPHLEAATVNAHVRWLPLDIKPDSDPNSLNVDRPGVVSVAVLSADDFDVTAAVVQSSLRWGPTGTEAPVLRCGAPEDANGDGLPDVVCKFNLADANFSVGDTLGILTGVLTDGTAFMSVDRVRII
jgi:hypothetical protein